MGSFTKSCGIRLYSTRSELTVVVCSLFAFLVSLSLRWHLTYSSGLRPSSGKQNTDKTGWHSIAVCTLYWWWNLVSNFIYFSRSLMQFNIYSFFSRGNTGKSIRNVFPWYFIEHAAVYNLTLAVFQSNGQQTLIDSSQHKLVVFNKSCWRMRLKMREWAFNENFMNEMRISE